MAQRRMFSKKITSTDAFLDMPLSSQVLYFHLCMDADDDGFVSAPKKIQRMIGAQEDDMNVLLGKRFILPFHSGVCVIKHWKIHNYIQSDRYCETTYTEEKAMLSTKDNNVYSLDTKSVQNVSTGKVRKGKVRKGKSKKPQNEILQKQVADLIYLFAESVNPTINYGHKTHRNACETIIEKFGYDKSVVLIEQALSVQDQQYAPVITTPTQLLNKMGELKVFFDKQKNTNKLIKIV